MKGTIDQFAVPPKKKNKPATPVSAREANTGTPLNSSTSIRMSIPVMLPALISHRLKAKAKIMTGKTT